MQLSKLLLVLGTLGAITCMTYVPTILFASTGLTSNSEGTRENFRYSFLLDIGFLAIGIAVQLALFTVALKWILAGASIIFFCWKYLVHELLCTRPSRVGCSVVMSFWAFVFVLPERSNGVLTKRVCTPPSEDVSRHRRSSRRRKAGNTCHDLAQKVHRTSTEIYTSQFHTVAASCCPAHARFTSTF